MDRAQRVAERVRAELMDQILRGELRDPAVQGLYVSGVKLSKDLRHARVYVRLLQRADPERRQAALQAVERAASFIRRSLGARLDLRYVPALRFYWDDTADTAARIESLLAEERSSGEGGSS